MDSDLANGSELSEAQKLQRLHAASHYHPVTVEDEQDETVGLPSGGAAPARAESSTARAQPVSEKSAGKQKESAKQSAPLDTQSQELFPKLGAVKPPAAQNPSVWTAKLGGLGLNGQANGAGTTNGVSRTSTPPSGTATPTSKPQGGPPPVTLPGRNQQGQVFDVPRKHILPDTQLKRKIPDLVKDINRRSRARLDFQPLEGRDSVRFVAVGPQEAGQQALKDLLQQILAKVSFQRRAMELVERGKY